MRASGKGKLRGKFHRKFHGDTPPTYEPAIGGAAPALEIAALNAGQWLSLVSYYVCRAVRAE